MRHEPRHTPPSSTNWLMSRVHVWVMSHTYACHDSWLTHICDTYTRQTWRASEGGRITYVRHESYIYETWLIHICDVTHTYMWHDSYIYATWLIHPSVTRVWNELSVMTQFVDDDGGRDSSPNAHIYVTWLIYRCDMTHTHMWHDSYIYVTGVIHTCVGGVWLGSRLIHLCDMTDPCNRRVCCASPGYYIQKLGYYT